MKRLTVATAAFAAGMIAVVCVSHAESDRAGAMRPALAKVAEAKDGGDAGLAKAGKKAKADGKAIAGRGKRKMKIDLAGVAEKAAEARGERVAMTSGKRPKLIATARKSVKGAAWDVAEDGGADAPAGKIASAGAYTTLVSHYATTYGVPYSLAHAVISIESKYRPNARGSAGEIGLMQIKPATARLMGYSGGTRGLFDPETNIKFGMKYLGLAHQLSGGSTCGTILRYNAGHGARHMNPVSAAYCSKVKSLL